MKNEPELECFVCHQRAKSVKKLEKHFRDCHKGIKVHRCCCDRTFDRRQRYADHMNSKHFLTKTFNCEKGCAKEFLSKTARLSHYRTVHRDSFHKATEDKL